MVDNGIIPNQNDVLFGRGGKNCRHEGNKLLRFLGRKHRLAYNNSMKKDKSLIAGSILNYFHGLDPPGRFIKQDSKSGKWREVSEHHAREKISQTLRDAAVTYCHQDCQQISAAGGTIASTRLSSMVNSSIEHAQIAYVQPSKSDSYELPARFLDNQQPFIAKLPSWSPSLDSLTHTLNVRKNGPFPLEKRAFSLFHSENPPSSHSTNQQCDSDNKSKMANCDRTDIDKQSGIADTSNKDTCQALVGNGKRLDFASSNRAEHAKVGVRRDVLKNQTNQYGNILSRFTPPRMKIIQHAGLDSTHSRLVSNNTNKENRERNLPASGAKDFTPRRKDKNTEKSSKTKTNQVFYPTSAAHGDITSPNLISEGNIFQTHQSKSNYFTKYPVEQQQNKKDFGMSRFLPDKIVDSHFECSPFEDSWNASPYPTTVKLVPGRDVVMMEKSSATNTMKENYSIFPPLSHHRSSASLKSNDTMKTDINTDNKWCTAKLSPSVMCNTHPFTESISPNHKSLINMSDDEEEDFSGFQPWDQEMTRQTSLNRMQSIAMSEFTVGDDITIDSGPLPFEETTSKSTMLVSGPLESNDTTKGSDDVDCDPPMLCRDISLAMGEMSLERGGGEVFLIRCPSNESIVGSSNGFMTKFDILANASTIPDMNIGNQEKRDSTSKNDDTLHLTNSSSFGQNLTLQKSTNNSHDNQNCNNEGCLLENEKGLRPQSLSIEVCAPKVGNLTGNNPAADSSIEAWKVTEAAYLNRGISLAFQNFNHNTYTDM